MIYIVTPLSRIENLETIYDSIFNSIPIQHQTQYRWVIVVDRNIEHRMNEIQRLKNKSSIIEVFSSGIKNSLAGHGHRNFFINKYNHYYDNNSNDWVYFLDDDTILHPNFHHYVFPEITKANDKKGILFHQFEKNGNIRLIADLINVKVGFIDMGQYLVNLSKIGTLRFDENDYCADGKFIETFYCSSPSTDFILIDKFCSVYNALRN